jgi:hypothetical protein
VSLSIDKYENPEDAKLRLRQTVVLYKGDPVLITDVKRGDTKEDILRVLFQPLPVNKGAEMKRFDPFAEKVAPEEAKRKYISSKHFDISPFKLGYVNSPKGAFYCSRLPNRVQKQGLCQENFQAVDHGGRAVPFASFLALDESVAMVKNVYPSFGLSLSNLDKVSTIAFHRDFCLVKDEVIPNLVYLYYKGAKVGMYTIATQEINLGTKFSCLKESLRELGLKVGVI